MGADLLVTDKFCTRAWSVQVKTNSSNSKSWLLNKDAKQIRSRSHVYVFVTAKRNSKVPIFYVVPSNVVAQAFKKFVRPHSTFYAFG